MPHVNVQLCEEMLDSATTPRLIRALTDAVVTVYPESFRSRVVVELFAIARQRWGIAGRPVAADAAVVTLNSREGLFHHPDYPDAAERLIAALGYAVSEVFPQIPPGNVMILLNGVPSGRTGVGGEVDG